MGGGVLIVEEAARDYAKVTYIAVLRGDAEEGGFFGDSAADANGFAKLQHGGGEDDVGDLVDNVSEVLAGHVVRGAGVVGPSDATAQELHFDHVGSNGRELVDRELFSGKAEGGDQNNGC